MTSAYIGLGSNLFEPIQQLRTALAAIAGLPKSKLRRVSSAWRSAAVGPGAQPDYLNAVLQLETGLSPRGLLGALQRIEAAQGRIRTVRWGARSLDLDILLYGDQQIATPSLTIPHPRLAERNFVLFPLAQICELNLVLPDGTELGTLIARCPQGDLVDTRLRLTEYADVPGDAEAQG
jgi:2-amino-4-hydroxy-6-hydroxymethyldihydropteridine diphosphokinase